MPAHQQLRLLEIFKNVAAQARAPLVADKERLDWMEYCIETKQAFVFDEQPGKLNLRKAIDAARTLTDPRES